MVVVLAVLCLTIMLAQTADKPIGTNEYMFSIPKFDSIAIAEADKAAEEILRNYTAAGGELVWQQLREAKTNAGKVRLIYVLGRIRYKQAVTELIKMIDLQAEGIDPKTAIARWGRYPAAEALARIGTDSTKTMNSIVRVLGTEENELRRKLMVRVLAEVLDKEVAQFAVERALKNAADAEKPNYEKALAVLQLDHFGVGD